jgi:predicted transcriptional regulator
MSAALLATIGATLYGEGEHWIGRLAEDLGVNERTMRRWLASESAIPARVWDDLINIAIGRAGEIADLVPKIDQAKLG